VTWYFSVFGYFKFNLENNILSPGYEEPGNVLDALEELEALNNAHNDVKKVQDCQRRCLDIF
jgi:hypothetical protein